MKNSFIVSIPNISKFDSKYSSFELEVSAIFDSLLPKGWKEVIKFDWSSRFFQVKKRYYREFMNSYETEILTSKSKGSEWEINDKAIFNVKEHVVYALEKLQEIESREAKRLAFEKRVEHLFNTLINNGVYLYKTISFEVKYENRVLVKYKNPKGDSGQCEISNNEFGFYFKEPSFELIGFHKIKTIEEAKKFVIESTPICRILTTFSTDLVYLLNQ